MTMISLLARWAKHLWLDAADARRILTPEGLQRLASAVHASEARHLGELRLCVEAGLTPAALWQGQTASTRAIALFSHLRVWDTERNNGVLIYLLLADRRIEILADRGLHARVDADIWQSITARLASALQAGDFEAGLTQAIQEVGTLLKNHFPVNGTQQNPNELPDSVVII